MKAYSMSTAGWWLQLMTKVVHPRTWQNNLDAANHGCGDCSNGGVKPVRPDVKAARAVWFEGFRHVTLDQIVFLDEFGPSSNMTRHYAREPPGPAHCLPHAARTLENAQHECGDEHVGDLAAGTFEEAVDEDTFVAFVEECLVAKLQPGQVGLFGWE